MVNGVTIMVAQRIAARMAGLHSSPGRIQRPTERIPDGNHLGVRAQIPLAAHDPAEASRSANLDFVARAVRRRLANREHAGNEAGSMQRFIAQLSTPIAQADFERSWSSDVSVTGDHKPVKFTFDVCKVLAVIDSEFAERWESASFYRTFSAAIRRVDRACNIRWV
jgi:hypothetical protein